ncbi:hypothetical protein NFHSH190041_19260 [Shewanella sp. NFH-SH190041]|nr:hypothetical protein NFHSH190041_19260 [Shewanella sp. NFH-SH190041]
MAVVMQPSFTVKILPLKPQRVRDVLNMLPSDITITAILHALLIGEVGGGAQVVQMVVEHLAATAFSFLQRQWFEAAGLVQVGLVGLIILVFSTFYLQKRDYHPAR